MSDDEKDVLSDQSEDLSGVEEDLRTETKKKINQLINQLRKKRPNEDASVNGVSKLRKTAHKNHESTDIYSQSLPGPSGLQRSNLSSSSTLNDSSSVNLTRSNSEAVNTLMSNVNVPSFRSDASTTVLCRIGDYLIGPTLGNSPVDSISQCIARKVNTDEFYTLKILTIKDEDRETQDDKQGKILIHTEHSLLSMLKEVPGVIRTHTLFQDYTHEIMGRYDTSGPSSSSQSNPERDGNNAPDDLSIRINNDRLSNLPSPNPNLMHSNIVPQRPNFSFYFNLSNSSLSSVISNSSVGPLIRRSAGANTPTTSENSPAVSILDNSDQPANPNIRTVTVSLANNESVVNQRINLPMPRAMRRTLVRRIATSRSQGPGIVSVEDRINYNRDFQMRRRYVRRLLERGPTWRGSRHINPGLEAWNRIREINGFRASLTSDAGADEGEETGQGMKTNGVNTGRVVRRICLVLDCVTPHVFSSDTEHLLSLQDYVMSRQSLPELEALNIFLYITNIIQNMHSRNVVHRDIKLGNLVINRITGSVTITNLCLGQYIMPGTPLLNDQRGSPAYTSPEVLSGQPYKGKPSDMWSLGVVLYTMLFGYFPFFDKSPTELFKKIKSAKYIMPRNIPVSHETENLLRSLLTVNPEERPTAETVQSLVSTIVSVRSGATTRSHEVSNTQLVPDVDVKQTSERPKQSRNESTASDASGSRNSAPRIPRMASHDPTADINTLLRNQLQIIPPMRYAAARRAREEAQRVRDLHQGDGLQVVPDLDGSSALPSTTQTTSSQTSSTTTTTTTTESFFTAHHASRLDYLMNPPRGTPYTEFAHRLFHSEEGRAFSLNLPLTIRNFIYGDHPAGVPRSPGEIRPSNIRSSVSTLTTRNATTNVPSTCLESTVTVNSVSTVSSPSLSTNAGTPSLSTPVDTPSLSATVGMPNLTTTASTSSLPTTVSTPSLPTTVSTPSLPTTVSTPSLPTTVSTPSLPTTVSTPSLLTTVSTPSLLTTVGTPSLPTTVGTPSLPTTVGTPSLQTTVGTHSLPTTFSIPNLPTNVGTLILPTTVSTSSLPTTVSTSTLPTTVGTSSLPTTVGTSSPPTTVSTSSPPTTVGTSSPPTTVGTSSPPTTVGTSSPPTTVGTSSPPTTVGTSSPPTTVGTSSPPTTVGSSSLPTTVGSSSLPTTVGSSSLPTTVGSSSLPTTVGSSSLPTTVGSSSLPTTVGSSSLPTTVGSSSLPTTVGSSSLPTTVGSSSLPTTVGSSSLPTTLDTSSLLSTVSTSRFSASSDTPSSLSSTFGMPESLSAAIGTPSSLSVVVDTPSTLFATVNMPSFSAAVDTPSLFATVDTPSMSAAVNTANLSRTATVSPTSEYWTVDFLTDCRIPMHLPTPNFNEPASLTSHQSTSPTLNQPASPTLNQPASPTLNLPASPTLNQPASPTLNQPASPTLNQPASPTLNQPASPTLNQPASPTLNQPASLTLNQPASLTLNQPTSPTLNQPTSPPVNRPSHNPSASHSSNQSASPTFYPPQTPTFESNFLFSPVFRLPSPESVEYNPNSEQDVPSRFVPPYPGYYPSHSLSSQTPPQTITQINPLYTPSNDSHSESVILTSSPQSISSTSESIANPSNQSIPNTTNQTISNSSNRPIPTTINQALATTSNQRLISTTSNQRLISTTTNHRPILTTSNHRPITTISNHRTITTTSNHRPILTTSNHRSIPTSFNQLTTSINLPTTSTSYRPNEFIIGSFSRAHASSSRRRAALTPPMLETRGSRPNHLSFLRTVMGPNGSPRHNPSVNFLPRNQPISPLLLNQPTYRERGHSMMGAAPFRSGIRRFIPTDPLLFTEFRQPPTAEPLVAEEENQRIVEGTGNDLDDLIMAMKRDNLSKAQSSTRPTPSNVFRAMGTNAFLSSTRSDPSVLSVPPVISGNPHRRPAGSSLIPNTYGEMRPLTAEEQQNASRFLQQGTSDSRNIPSAPSSSSRLQGNGPTNQNPGGSNPNRQTYFSPINDPMMEPWRSVSRHRRRNSNIRNNPMLQRYFHNTRPVNVTTDGGSSTTSFPVRGEMNDFPSLVTTAGESSSTSSFTTNSAGESRNFVFLVNPPGESSINSFPVRSQGINSSNSLFEVNTAGENGNSSSFMAATTAGTSSNLLPSTSGDIRTYLRTVASNGPSTTVISSSSSYTTPSLGSSNVTSGSTQTLSHR